MAHIYALLSFVISNEREMDFSHSKEGLGSFKAWDSELWEHWHKFMEKKQKEEVLTGCKKLKSDSVPSVFPTLSGAGSQEAHWKDW